MKWSHIPAQCTCWPPANQGPSPPLFCSPAEGGSWECAALGSRHLQPATVPVFPKPPRCPSSVLLLHPPSPCSPLFCLRFMLPPHLLSSFSLLSAPSFYLAILLLFPFLSFPPPLPPCSLPQLLSLSVLPLASFPLQKTQPFLEPQQPGFMPQLSTRTCCATLGQPLISWASVEWMAVLVM